PLAWLAIFFFSSRRRHTRFSRDWSSGVLFRSAVVGLGEPEAPDHLGAGELRQEAPPLLLGAERVDGVHHERRLHAGEGAVAGVQIGRASCRERGGGGVEGGGGATAGEGTRSVY